MEGLGCFAWRMERVKFKFKSSKCTGEFFSRDGARRDERDLVLVLLYAIWTGTEVECSGRGDMNSRNITQILEKCDSQLGWVLLHQVHVRHMLTGE